ncbi:hypothetical protein [Geothrix sp. 21YS21S-2]|uniref:hypothetical protein n=1 Tax=Geothrix sp. 21YS21S-2 TaxID=3068893 RepID=UPI0027BAC394|nr:hypothetical protein [Geothrix sp. 21YS21S-2]
MALTNNSPRAFEQGDRNEFPLTAAVVVYEGSAVGINPATGYARALVAGDTFVGFSEAKVDNTLGAAGDKTVRVIDEGKVQLAISGVAITDLGKPVFASDDNTFTLTQGSNTYIGRVSRWIATGIAVVAYESEFGGVNTELTYSVGTPATAIADVTASFVQATLNNNFASLAAAIIQMQRMLK